MEKYIIKIGNKTLLMLALLSVWGAIVYRFYALNLSGVISAVVLAAISYLIIVFIELKINKKPTQLIIKNRALDFKNSQNNFTLFNLLFLTLYLSFASFCFFYLFKGQTVDSVISPWQAVPNIFLFSIL